MTKDEALKLALEALEDYRSGCQTKYDANKAITSIREALEQPEPVIDKSAATRIATSLGWEPKRKPLTERQLIEIGMQMFGDSKSPGSDPTIKQFNKIARTIEAKHGIKE